MSSVAHALVVRYALASARCCRVMDTVLYFETTVELIVCSQNLSLRSSWVIYNNCLLSFYQYVEIINIQI